MIIHKIMLMMTRGLSYWKEILVFGSILFLLIKLCIKVLIKKNK